jgi:hypothetical protein
LPSLDDRPTTDSSDEELDPFFSAFMTIRLGSRNADGELDNQAWQDLGFDLDGLCSGGPSCIKGGTKERACESLLGDANEDGRHCRDNQIGLLDYNLDTIEITSGKYMGTDRDVNCAICQGAYNVLMRVSGYNGGSNDSSVRVDLYPSPGLETPKDVDCDSDPWDTSSCWERGDPWMIDAAHVEGAEPGDPLGNGKLYDPSAYVRDHWLVMRLPENAPFGLVSNDEDAPKVVRIVLNEGYLVARLEQSDDGWTSREGLVAGRTKLTDLVAEFERIGLCEATDPAAFALIQNFVRSAADVLSTGANAADTPCDALSVGIGIDSIAATAGELVAVDDTPALECE